MPWRCPACKTEIYQKSLEPTPDPTQDYRGITRRTDPRVEWQRLRFGGLGTKSGVLKGSRGT